MSNKRDLYKPAPAAQTPPRAARRSLTQGCLTRTDPRSFLNNTSPIVSGANQSPSRKATPGSHARRSLNYNTVLASRKNPNTPSQHISPTITRSPAKVKPSASLSLSETEDEPKKAEVREINLTAPLEPSVLAVDASQRHVSRVDNEVPIKASYIKSPAKVVCHSPKRKTASQGSAASPGHYGNAGKISIPVETVPSVNISHTALPSHRNDSQSTCSPPSEDGSLSTVAGSPVDPRSKAVETVVVQEKNNPRSYVSFLDDGSSDFSLASNAPSLDQSEVHVGQPKFDETGISSTAGASRLDGGAEGVTKKKKKKTTRVVQSKYMASAMSRIGDKPPIVKRTENQLSSKTAAASTRVSNLAKGRKTKTGNVSKSLAKDTRNESLVTNVKKPMFTSTPADVPLHDGALSEEGKPSAVQKPDSLVPSGFLSTSSYLNTPSKEQGRSVKTGKETHPSKDSKSERTSQTRSGKQTGDISQLQLDLIHARLCQWRFLRLKATDAFKKQEKDAQEWFYAMSLLNQQTADRNLELRQKLAEKKKEEEVDRQLELQLSLLRTLDSQSRLLFPEYDKFCEGIDTTRHYLPVKDILMPMNEDELLAALNILENNLGEISALIENEESKILSFSDEMQALAETVQTETEEHERCTELLAATRSLATQEQSLQAELIERNER